jgi:hypothetical protein
MAFTSPSYTTGNYQFEADFYVFNGTTGSNIFQIFGGNSTLGWGTSLMLRVYDGVLRNYRDDLILDKVYNRWFHLNV